MNCHCLPSRSDRTTRASTVRVVGVYEDHNAYADRHTHPCLPLFRTHSHLVRCSGLHIMQKAYNNATDLTSFFRCYG